MDSSYNNLGGFGSSGVSFSAPVSSDVGDVILTPEKKSHKKGIIVAFVLVVAIIIGVFVVFLILKNNKLSAGEDAKLAFNRYANYLLFGEDSDAALEGEYDEGDIFKLDEMRNENEQAKMNYFNNANELLNSFELLVANSNNNDFLKEIANYRADFELVKATFDKEFITEKELVDEVLNNDLDSTKAWIEKKFISLTKSSSDTVRQYADVEIQYYQLNAEYLESLKVKDCFNAENLCENEIDEALESQIIEYGDEIVAKKRDAVNNLLAGCWKIEKMMNDEGET